MLPLVKASKPGAAGQEQLVTYYSKACVQAMLAESIDPKEQARFCILTVRIVEEWLDKNHSES
jgi:hypothetical protein